MTVLEPIIQYISSLTRTRVNLQMVIEGADRPRKPVLRVMDRLVKEGYLVEIEDNKIPPKYGECGRDRRNPTWKIIKNPLVDDFVPRPERNTDRDKMWRVIRAKRRFTKVELGRIACVEHDSCESYVCLLSYHKILRKLAKDGRRQVYMLVKDSGPKRPVTPERKKRRKQHAK